MKALLCVIFILTTLPYSAWARPVSYPGGITLMQGNNMDNNSLHIHYSPTAKYSIGYRGEYWRNQKWQFHGAQLNTLLKRWNRLASQSNIYIKSGLGISQRRDKKTGLAAFTGIAMDWENRRFLTSYENRFYEAENIDRFFMQTVRAGIAPYIGDYGDLHTWFILQVNHSPKNDDPVTVTPLIRLFKSEYLAEFGLSEQGKPLINFIVRF